MEDSDSKEERHDLMIRCRKTKNIEAANRLHALGVTVWAFIMPVLPGITDVRRMMEALDEEIPVWLHKLHAEAHCTNGLKMLAFMRRHRPDLIPLYEHLVNGGDDVYYEQLKTELADNPRVKFLYG